MTTYLYEAGFWEANFRLPAQIAPLGSLVHIGHDRLSAEGAALNTLRYIWFVLLIVAAAAATSKLVDDNFPPGKRTRATSVLTKTIVSKPSDYAFLNSKQPINERYGQISKRQTEVERELQQLRFELKAQEPSSDPFFNFGVAKNFVRPKNKEELAAINVKITQLQAEGDKLREQATAELLTDCRQRMMRRGVVVGNGPCTDLDEIVRNLATGTYSFNRPKMVILGEDFVLRLILQTQESQTINFDGAPGSIRRVEHRPFAQSVEATLSGQDFEIFPNGPQPKTATAAQSVEWNWKLNPKAVGTKTLTIEVAVNIISGADKQRVQIDSLREEVEIQVTFTQRVKAYVADINGALVATAAVLTPVAAILGFFPAARKSIVAAFSRLRRRRARQT
ncbi:hypothetical protein [Bradyrhizobium sp. SZCCHNR3003]|uniref:hypothetical protein n=1 Tax=Bradyrhizobium sp. SZCCHNR3003 TaxID=3057387 RepID=UPI002916E793|nr:hypothetical protein [Bradyrhizobium sp. SZCCHNR3003]